MAKIGVEILDPADPVRCDCELGPRAGGPARVQVQRFVGIVDHPRRLQVTSERPREPTRCVGHPVIERVAQAAAHRRHEFDLFRDVGVRCGAEPREMAEPFDAECASLAQRRHGGLPGRPARYLGRAPRL